MEKPNFKEMETTDSAIEYNREIYRRREREGYTCPKNYELDAVPCHRCEVGSDSCAAACHPRTYYPGQCPTCKKDAWFDPESLSGVCVDCLAQKS